MKAQLSILAPLISLLYPTLVSAIFKCSDQTDYKPTPGKFVVHYTSIRDSNIPSGEPWIRICQRNADGNWVNIDPLVASCDAGHPVTFSAAEASLPHAIKVTNGHGCSETLHQDLDGAALDYDGQHRDLGGDPADGCGARDHGITCQFSL